MAKSFDYQVDHRGKDGKVVRHDPYRMVIDQENGPRMERPPGSGKWYKPDGSLWKDESEAIAKAKEADAKAAQKVTSGKV